MKDSSRIPDAVRPLPYPLVRDLKLNSWAIVALLVSAVGRSVLGAHPEWDTLAWTTIALAPLPPSLLWIWSLARWIRGMDEMQRRIQTTAALFASLTTLLAAIALSQLSAAGVAIPRLEHGLGWEGSFALVVIAYITGIVQANRRYR